MSTLKPLPVAVVSRVPGVVSGLAQDDAEPLPAAAGALVGFAEESCDEDVGLSSVVLGVAEHATSPATRAEPMTSGAMEREMFTVTNQRSAGISFESVPAWAGGTPSTARLPRVT